MLSRVQLLASPWTVAHQAPLSMGFFRLEYWRGLPVPSPWDLHNPGIRVGCHSLLKGDFLIQALNPGLLHCRQILSCLSHPGSPVTTCTQQTSGMKQMLCEHEFPSLLGWGRLDTSLVMRVKSLFSIWQPFLSFTVHKNELWILIID